MKTRLWSSEEIIFLTNNYAELGSVECATILNRTKDSVKMKAYKLKLVSPRSKRRTNESYDAQLFEIESTAYRVGDYINDRTPIEHECVKEHKWFATPNNILTGSSCPTCAKKGIDFTKPALLYFVSFVYDEITYYKIGITNKTVKERFRDDWKNLQMQLVWQVAFVTGRKAHKKEQELKRENAAYLHNTGAFYAGNTETFTVKIPKPLGPIP